LRYINDLKGPFDKLLLSFGLDHFGYHVDTHYVYRDQYLKWEPLVALRLKPSAANTHLTQWVKYRFARIEQVYGKGLLWETGYYETSSRKYGIHELAWQMNSDFILRPFEARANLQAGQGFVRLNLRYKQQFTGRTKHLGTWVHGYVGWLPVYDQPEAEVQFAYTGQPSFGHHSTDYMFDQWLGGRNASSGLFAHQIFERDAHLRTLSTEGIGDKWLIGAGISQAVPFRFLHVYMDVAVFPSAIQEETTFSYSGGAALVLLKDVFEINLPILESKDIRESLTYQVRDMWFERITFTANLKLGNPPDVLDRMQLGF
jgi:hypothetical protein